MIRTHYLDTSAIVKLLIEEEGSIKLREYFSIHAVFATTNICFAETLGVLKNKHLRRFIDQETYFSASEEIAAYLRGNNLKIEDIGISDRRTFNEVETLSRKYTLDISDSYQLVTLKRGFYSQFLGESQPILITADRDLADAARSEGLRVWDCLREDAP